MPPPRAGLVSSSFKTFKWFPSPRKTQGLKKKTTIRDKTFALSSAKAVALLKEERKKNEQEKEKAPEQSNSDEGMCSRKLGT